MLFIDNRGATDPRMNLALEEFALRNLRTDEDCLLFYINEPSVIIGRHQNTLEEINLDYVEAHSIHVVRRISGGGAVYHDPGNLNFSFITRFDKSHFNNYKKFTAPVIRTLNKLGVPAELNGRNDIVAGGRKISGNAQFTSKNRMFSHGTLLFDSNLEDVVASLKVKKGKFESKGIKSVRSRVANISEFLDKEMDILEFRQVLLENIFEETPDIPRYDFSDAELQQIESLAKTKYSSWDWNFGESPKFNVKNAHRFPFGEIEVRILVDKGLIQNIKFYGDFFAQRDIGELEKLLTNIRYEREDIDEAIRNSDLTQYFGLITPPEFLDLLY